MMQSSPFNYRRFIVWIGRIVLGAIFLYAGYSKLFFPTEIPHWPVGIALAYFAMQVDSYQMLSPGAVNFVAHTLPFVELALGLLLLIGWQLRIWGTIVSAVILGFFIAVVRSYALGLQINCGCFAKPEPITIWKVIEDGLLLALAVAMTAFSYIESRKPHPWSAQVEDTP
jgi:uncharacterized membrane protein YphA (DoxX/SURF4 family)